jgi:uncharacterized membrane protein
MCYTKLDRINILVFLLILLWTVSLVIVPFMIPSSYTHNLAGSSWAIDNFNQFSPMNIYPKVVYLIGDITCHQIAERSYYFNDNQMAVCSRCFGIYLGILIGMVVALIKKINLTGKFVVIVLLSVLPLGIDGTGQLFGYWVSTNTLRLITGLLAGTCVGAAFVVSVVELQNIIHLIKKALYTN